MTDTIKSLTEKETALFKSVVRGMDNPGSGWLHEMAEEGLSTNAVLGSLIKKGLVHSQLESGCVFVEISDEAAKHLGMEWDGWGFTPATVEIG